MAATAEVTIKRNDNSTIDLCIPHASAYMNKHDDWSEMTRPAFVISCEGCKRVEMGERQYALPDGPGATVEGYANRARRQMMRADARAACIANGTHGGPECGCHE